MPGVIDIARGAVGNRVATSSSGGTKSPVLFAVPKPNRDLDVLERESPRLRIDLGIGHDPVDRATPGPTRTFETGIRMPRFPAEPPHRIGCKNFSSDRPQPNRNSSRRKRTRHMKEHSQNAGTASGEVQASSDKAGAIRCGRVVRQSAARR